MCHGNLLEIRRMGTLNIQKARGTFYFDVLAAWLAICGLYLGAGALACLTCFLASQAASLALAAFSIAASGGVAVARVFSIRLETCDHLSTSGSAARRPVILSDEQCQNASWVQMPLQVMMLLGRERAP